MTPGKISYGVNTRYPLISGSDIPLLRVGRYILALKLLVKSAPVSPYWFFLVWRRVPFAIQSRHRSIRFQEARLSMRLMLCVVSLLLSVQASWAQSVRTTYV